MVELHRRGVHTALICSRPFEHLARKQAKILGFAGLNLILVDHPLAGVGPSVVRERAKQAVEQVCMMLHRTA